MKDYYYILGLDANSTQDEIKEVYRKLSKKLHPDLNQGDEYFENRFKDIQEAFETLRDPVKRAIYDTRLNQFRANAEVKKQQSYDKAYRPGPTRPPAAAPKTKRATTLRKGPGLGFDIALCIVAIVVAVYLYRWFTSKPSFKPVYQEIATPVASIVHVKHKHKHPFKNKPAADSVMRHFHYLPEKVAVATRLAKKPAADKAETVEVPLVVDKPATRAAATRPFPKTGAVVKTIAHHDFLYETFVHPNVTGIVPMRAYNTFSSNIIASIPGHSKVLVLERGDTSYRVCYDKSIGFVPKWSLEEK